MSKGLRMFSSGAKLHPKLHALCDKKKPGQREMSKYWFGKRLKGGCLKINKAAAFQQNVCYRCSDGEELLIPMNKLVQCKSHYRIVAFPDRAGEERDEQRATKCEHKQINKLVAFFFLKLKYILIVNLFIFVFSVSHCVFGDECVYLTQ